MQFIERIKNIWANLKLPELAGLDTPTGAESLTNQELVELIAQKTRPNDMRARLLDPWAYGFHSEFLWTDSEYYRPEAVRSLKERMGGLPVIELACGEQAEEHRGLFCDVLGASDYRAVERRDNVAAPNYVEIGDLLPFLAKMPTASSHIVAFGLFNEPMLIGDFYCPAPTPAKASLEHLDNEYLRRVCREMYRILPKDGMFFGSGLYPLGSIDTSVVHLKAAGFVEDHSFIEKMSVAKVHLDSIRGMFFFGKS